jgi:two-component system, NtrC family, nitrogen regulation sensor histidine kinase NtrY
MTHKRGASLQFKLTIGLVVIVMVPLAVSYFLIDQIGKVAANFAAGEADTHVVVMDKALDVYRDLFVTTKNYEAEVADRLAHRPDLLAPKMEGSGFTPGPGIDPKANLDILLTDTLRGVAVLRADGTVVKEAERPPTGPGWRDKVLDQPLGTLGATLRLTFEVSATLQDDYQELKSQVDTSRQVITQVRNALPEGYRTAFFVMMALAGLAAVAFGIVASTLVTRRIAALVTTARKVSDGHLDARVELRGKDEMVELGDAFNTMLDDLAQTRSQIEYLQRIGMWQDVARRLAHEIKNPLTPIQLAVQQTVSAYKGDDAKFKRLLTDTKEIVEEEIEGLRRLVDTFRTLGQLPKVEKHPIELSELIEELKLDPTFATRLELHAPAKPVTVRADKLLLKRVLANLVENGIHAGADTPGSGKVAVTWRAEADSVTITVDDSGKGVPDDAREKIFEPYVTTKATGTGLGLAIARKIAIEHGGELALSPERAPTGGARFVITLPLRGPEASLA